MKKINNTEKQYNSELIARNVREFNTSSIVRNGIVTFDLVNNSDEAFFTRVYKDSIELRTNNEKFDYIFSDCSVSTDNKKLQVTISRTEGSILSFIKNSIPANNIKVYLSIIGEYEENKS